MKFYLRNTIYDNYVIMCIDGKERFAIGLISPLINTPDWKAKILNQLQEASHDEIEELRYLYRATKSHARRCIVTCEGAIERQLLHFYRYTAKLPHFRYIYVRTSPTTATVMVKTENVHTKLATFSKIEHAIKLAETYKNYSPDELEMLLFETRGILTSGVLRKILKKHNVKQLDKIVEEITRKEVLL